MTEQIEQVASATRLDTLRCHASAMVVSLPLLFSNGCAHLSDLLGEPIERRCHDPASCWPVEVSEKPPGAMIDISHRCVDPAPIDAVPAPAGSYLSQWRGAMSYGAQEQHWVVSRNEWFDGGSQLGPAGKQHVDRIAKCLMTEPRSVVIETEPVALEMRESYEDAVLRNRRLQMARRMAVVAALAEGGVENADQWVIFAEDRMVGVRGIEAPQVFNQQFGSGRGNRGRVGQGQGGQNGMGGGGGGALGGGGGFGGGGAF